jgi:tetratricopeptide (TPR) repeat protein
VLRITGVECVGLVPNQRWGFRRGAKFHRREILFEHIHQQSVMPRESNRIGLGIGGKLGASAPAISEIAKCLDCLNIRYMRAKTAGVAIARVQCTKRRARGTNPRHCFHRVQRIEEGASHCGYITMSMFIASSQSEQIMSDRLTTLKSMVEQNPNDAFARYGLAMEHANLGDLQQAIDEYAKLLEAHPNYSAGYYHAGRTLEKMGRSEEARAMYERGIDVTSRNGDAHTRSELQAALDML